MTSSSTLTICLSTKPMFRKNSEDSMLMDSVPKPISASSMSPPANTLDICCHLKASPWPHSKSRLSKIGPSPERSKSFDPSLALPTSTDISFMDTPNCCTTHMSNLKGYHLELYQ